MGRAQRLHQRVNPQRWKVNGAEYEGTGGPFRRQLDLLKGGFGEKISGPLLIAKADLPFTPLEGMAVVDLSDNSVYKIGAVDKDAWSWKLTVEANKNPTAKPVPATR